MKKKLYLVRHGETLFNRKGLIQGWCDSPLTKFGHIQAKATKEWMEKNGIHPDSFYCSTLGRTEETLQDMTDKPYKKLEGIREMYYGIMEGEKISRAQPGMDLDPMGFYTQFGGEHRLDVGKRMYKTIEEVMKSDPGQSILMCTHGACSFQFARLVDLEKAKRLRKFKNCTVYEFEYEFDENDIEKPGKFTLNQVTDDHVAKLENPDLEQYQKIDQEMNVLLDKLAVRSKSS